MKMTKEELINELQNYQMYLGEFVSDFVINESICDFNDENQSKFHYYGNCLSKISSALKYRQHMLCYLLFYKSSDGKSIPRLLNRIKSTSILDDKELSRKIREIASQADDTLSKASQDIDNLKEYRHNVYAHWNDELFNTEWQNDFANNHKFNYENILELGGLCFRLFGEILNLLGSQSFVGSVENNEAIQRFICKLKE